MRWWRRQRERDLERELRSDLELEADEQRERGLSAGDARRAAHRAFGNAALIGEATREAWGYAWAERLVQDLRYAWRAWRTNPGFAAVMILTAALGIGANTAIFSVIDAVLLRPLPFPDAERLVCPMIVARDAPVAESRMPGFSVADYRYAAWRDAAAVFDGIAVYSTRPFTITSDGEPERLKAIAVTPGFLRMLGVSPLMGRDFTAADAAPRGGQVAILAHAFWKRRFGGDAAILSRSMTLEGKPYSIAGVLPREFEFPGAPEVSLLVAFTEPNPPPRGATYFYSAIARLKRGVTAARAEADLAVIDGRLARAIDSKALLIGLHDKLVGNVRPALLVLGGAVGLVLLIVCVNVCNLLLARAISRQKEIAVRIALGAGRGRVLRQLLTEGMLLAGAGGAAGLAVAFGGVKLLLAIAPKGVPHIEAAHLSGTVLAFNAGVAICAGILFGLAPLRGVSGMDPEAALKQTARSASGGRGQRRLENLLIVAETAFALILLAGAGLLMRTFAGLTAISPGFEPDRAVTAQVALPFWKYRTPQRQREFLRELLDRARSGPGVQSVGATACLPYGGFVMTDALKIDGREVNGDAETAVNFAAGDYFRAMGIAVVEGRAIDDSDQAGRPGVAVVNQTLARRFFPDGRAVGSRIRVGGVTGWMEVVGVVGDVRQGGLVSETRAEITRPVAQVEGGVSAQTVAIRSTADPRVLGTWLRAQVAELDGELPAPQVITMREKMAALMASQVFVMRLLGLFAGIAIALAAIGIYSVLVSSVERRAHEMAIRVALGAKRAHILRLVMGRGLRLSLAGAAIGAAGGLGLTRYLKSLLYGVTPHDPATMAVGCGLVVLVALGAAYLPARKATQQDAVANLRAE
jgi:putative ABC transport system permease protein